MTLAGSDFYKVSGGGNDFVALVSPSWEPTASEVRAVCRRGLSIGADGLFLLLPIEDGSIRMSHFNADGSYASLCLNGTRCAARLAFELGWAEEQVTLVTGAGPIQGEIAGADQTRLHLPPPQAEIEAFGAALEGGNRKGWRTVVGVPHLVIPWQGPIAAAPVEEVGAALVHHGVAGPEGANVNFVFLRGAEEDEPAGFDIRTYERGVNAETLACGTGVMASALCLYRAGQADFPLTAHTAGGFDFSVDAVKDGQTITEWSLTGDARIVAQGRIFPGALPG